MATEIITTFEVSNSNERSNGRWTKEEHKRFVDAIKVYGKNWKKVEESVGTRTGAQIRSHAQKFFLKVEKDVKTNNKGNTKKSNKKFTEVSIATFDNISESGKSEDNLKGNLSFHEICENVTEASENSTALPTTTENHLIAAEKSTADVSNMQIEKATDNYNKLSKSQLLSKLKACEEKVDEYNQLVKKFSFGTTSTSNHFGTPLSGKTYHHSVYLDLMSYFSLFNKTAKSLKISDFVDISCKTRSNDENSYEVPVGMKKVRIL